MKRTILPGLVAALVLVIFASGLLFGGQGKGVDPSRVGPVMLICHSDNPNAPGIIIPVTWQSLKMHYAHGDRTGIGGQTSLGQIGDCCSNCSDPKGPPKGKGKPNKP